MNDIKLFVELPSLQFFANRVNFGINNVHYAVITEQPDGTFEYATPVRIPGAVSLTETTVGDNTRFYADNGVYYSASSNQGYEMTLTFAKIAEQFRIDVLGETLVNGGLYENGNARQQSFALLFEIDGDAQEDKFVYYNCTATRPGTSTSTRTETTEVNTNELTITASPRTSDRAIRWITGETTDQAIKDGFYDAVVEPVTIP